MTKAFAEFLESQICTFVDCEDDSVFGVDKLLCFRVNMNVSKPLRERLSVMMEEKPKWIRITLFQSRRTMPWSCVL